MKKFIAALAFVPMMAHAEFFTGNKLLGLLQSSSTLDRVHALGYIQGVFDAHMGSNICPPNNVTAGQVNDMIQNYLENSPSVRNKTADIIIRDAFKGIWPCANRGRNGV